MIIIPANGANIPAIGFGTWPLNGAQCSEMVKAALAAGYRHIDTAAFYENEAAIGQAIRQSGVAREQIFLTTKIWPTDIADGALQKSMAASLQRLALDHVDLALIHWPSKTVQLAESIGALNDLVTRGMAKNIGLSNFTNALVDRAVALSDQPLACNQVENHPYLDQTKLRATCARHSMALIAYCPLSRGGNLLSEPAIVDAAKNHHKSPAQIVLRWHVEHPAAGAIPKTATPGRLAENLDIFDFRLDGDELAAISKLLTSNQRICDFDFSPDWD